MPTTFKHLTIPEILRMADRHHQITAQWPISRDGPVHGEDNLTWEAVNTCLRKGGRGLPGGNSLARVLAKHRPVVDRRRIRPDLTVKQIKDWAQSHHLRTGQWPQRESGPVREAPDVSWATVNRTLRRGGTNLPGGSSLVKFLREQFGMWSSRGNRRLSHSLILKWADEHFARTGKWPIVLSGRIHKHPQETWAAINEALRHGRRGLPGQSTLTQLLTEQRGVKYNPFVAQLSVRQILAWSDDYFSQNKRWPTAKSGRNSQARMSWALIDRALRQGGQGLPGGSSLSETLAARRRTTTIEVKPKAISARRKSSSHRSRKPAQRASQRTSNFSWAEFDRKQAAR
jgi:hypothetical protein